MCSWTGVAGDVRKTTIVMSFHLLRVLGLLHNLALAVSIFMVVKNTDLFSLSQKHRYTLLKHFKFHSFSEIAKETHTDGEYFKIGFYFILP